MQYGVVATRIDDYSFIGHLVYDQIAVLSPAVIDKVTNEAVVIDPGGNNAVLQQYLSESGATVKYILLTHTHYDHLVGAEELSQALDMAVTVHKDDVRLLKQSPNFALLFDKVKFTAPKRLEILEGEGELPFGHTTIKVLHMPGHTPGSVCYLFDGFCFIGDLILEKGAGRTDLPGGNNDLLKLSLDKLTGMDKELLLFPGHDAPFTVGQLNGFYPAK